MSGGAAHVVAGQAGDPAQPVIARGEAGLAELEKLVAERPPRTAEQFGPNDFYGHATVLKRYCGLPPSFSLPGIHPHGPSVNDTVWDFEATHPLPTLLVVSKHQQAIYARRCAKPAVAIGSPLYYASRLIAQEAQELARHATGTLVFPYHSTHHVTVEFDEPAFVACLKQLPPEWGPVVVCLYWRDIQLGRHRAYVRAGFACTSAGHMFDPDFMFRLVRLLAGRRRCLTNEMGTCALYAAALGLPVVLHRQDYRLESANAKYLADASTRPNIPLAEQFLATANLPLEAAAQEQRKLAEEALGYESLLAPGELRAVLEGLARAQEAARSGRTWTGRVAARVASMVGGRRARRSDRRRPPLPSNPDPAVAEECRLLRAREAEAAFVLLNRLKAARVPCRDVDYLRGVCFLERAEPIAAVEALKEELRYFPDHAAAQALLEQLAVPPPAAALAGDPEFQELYRLIRPCTMVGSARLASLFRLARQVCHEDLPGNFVECGVAAGGSSALLAAVMVRHTRRPRRLFCCDTFLGMPAPSAADRHAGQPAMATGWGAGTCAAPESSLRELCRKLAVEEVVEPVKGLFADTLPLERGRIGPVALLHVDGDWYESTRDILTQLYDQVVAGGYVQIDDYGFWEGCRQAVTDFQAARGLKLELHPIDETGVWTRK